MITSKTNPKHKSIIPEVADELVIMDLAMMINAAMPTIIIVIRSTDFIFFDSIMLFFSNIKVKLFSKMEKGLFGSNHIISTLLK
jgi:hypothetical protein